MGVRSDLLIGLLVTHGKKGFLDQNEHNAIRIVHRLRQVASLVGLNLTNDFIQVYIFLIDVLIRRRRVILEGTGEKTPSGLLTISRSAWKTFRTLRL